MPFTPFHFGPGACLALPLKERLDLPVFLLSNLAIDLEPLAVISFGLKYPLHGYAHTLLFGSLVGIGWAALAFAGRRHLRRLMNRLRLPYRPDFRIMAISALLGAWFHVLLDAPLYSDIRPFYPLTANPLHGKISGGAVYLVCLLAFIPAAVLYLQAAGGKRAENDRAGLVKKE
ncbi:MAG TPA: hydrolase [bacterium]|uniref:Inner membrane protein n=1 Tax=candidate division TA06 bacterium ADurb.Bin417 TaxID=1852828 RepID=A0A1V5MBQ0_UNCT6|nr:MAG: hypothetical protein BWY73_01283 [candidate division TA06 bacterium ADurb.Bin417]HNQ34465.1 hydrolase [bacterium]HNS48126.1 hydrolase [bacterium]